MTNKIRVLHIITGTDTGGAEMMLSKLASQHNRALFDVEILSLLPIGVIGERIAALGIPVWTANMERNLPSPHTIRALTAQVKASSPDVVQTWMYHADLLGGIAAKKAGIKTVAWNLRHGSMNLQMNKRSTLVVMRLCALMSRRIPRKIVCCSHVAQQIHSTIGYDIERMQVIPNGFDLRQFRPNPAARAKLRAELRIDAKTPVIGLAARFNPQKDHGNFIAAAALLHKQLPDVQFVLCGQGITRENASLTELICSRGLESQFHLLGGRSDISDVTAAFDLAASSSSHGEAFPNVLGEAMACGVPCVATDVGDSRLIIGETGICVPPKQPLALAEAWQQLLSETLEQRQTRSKAARERVKSEFNLPDITRRYEALYTALVG